MILVLGSTGTTGGEVARQLIAAGRQPRLLVRSAGKAREFQNGAELVEGDLDRPESVEAAMKGVERMYLVSSGVRGRTQEIEAIDAAKRAGVEQVVKLSVFGADAPAFTIAKWHAEVEKHLIGSGLAWTMLRPVNFTTNALSWADSILSSGAFYQPTGDGRWAAIDPVDIGAVAVQALTGQGHAGKGYTLTGPEALSAAQYAQKISAAIGKPVTFVDVPPEAAHDQLLKTGMPTEYVDALLDLFAAMKAGKLGAVADGVERGAGKKPSSFDDWIRRNATAFR
jgi:uncharacterized protein YbjT (DUF2867 family)